MADPKVYVDDRDGVPLRAAGNNGALHFWDIKYKRMQNDDIEDSIEAVKHLHDFIISPGLSLNSED